MNIETKVQEILIAHGLDFEIEKLPFSAMDKKGNTLISPYYGLYNMVTGGCINSVKEGYGVSQNRELVTMVLEGMSKFGSQLSVTKAGSINGGKRVFFQLEIEGAKRLGHETLKQYVTIIDSNDGSTGLSVGIGDKVMHCENQFFQFYKGSNAKFRHTATIQQKIASIPSLIELALEKSLKQVRTYEKFMSTPLTKNLANLEHRMVKEVLGYDKVITSVAEQAKLTKRSEKIMDTLYEAIHKEYQDSGGKTVWGLFNGLTRFTTHDTKEYKKENGYMESMIMGTNYDKAIVGFEFLEGIVQ
jgi:hypothetical protein